jgi:single-strand DNA-binding protein
MAKSINLVILQGNLTKDPELRYTPNGNPVVNFTIATNEPFKDGDEWKEKAEFHNIVMWGKQAEFVSQYFVKGDKVTVTGRLQTRKWEKDGINHYMTEIIAREFVPAGQRKRDDKPPIPNDEGGDNFKGEVEDIVIPDDFGEPDQAPENKNQQEVIGKDDNGEELPF